MTASNGGIPSEDIKNYFNSVQTPFPIPNEGKIDTIQFLEAARGVVSLIDQFGNVFAPVKYDMSGNIEKLTQVYNTDLQRHGNLNDMVLLEHSTGGILATDALMWLRRALHLIQRFFELILEDNNSTGGSTEELVVFLKMAYKETLNVYHNWPLQMLFSVLSRMCPTRTKFYQIISLERCHSEAVVYRDMATFTASLRNNVEVLAAFYQDNQLEVQGKV
ncbi:glycolipid transfer protein [Homalodisca vitripennis]|uniref:glycolipid transfer protein n=1 Tax=Homalodisca vitripennis TaxID=197043 RepID=UPI001EECE9D3|nr:glycolipid transfer protein [Homalodisca vitripennis]